MNLQSALRQPDFIGLTDVEAIAFGNQLVTQSSSELWSFGRVVTDQRFGKTVATSIYDTIVVIGDAPAALLYVTHGIDLSLADVQLGLDAIARANPALTEASKTLKSLGVWKVSRWQSLGVDPPTLDAIAEARKTIATKADRDRIVNAWTSVSNALAAGEITTFEQATTLFGEQNQ